MWQHSWVCFKTCPKCHNQIGTKKFSLFLSCFLSLYFLFSDIYCTNSVLRIGRVVCRQRTWFFRCTAREDGERKRESSRKWAWTKRTASSKRIIFILPQFFMLHRQPPCGFEVGGVYKFIYFEHLKKILSANSFRSIPFSHFATSTPP